MNELFLSLSVASWQLPEGGERTSREVEEEAGSRASCILLLLQSYFNMFFHFIASACFHLNFLPLLTIIPPNDQLHYIFYFSSTITSHFTLPHSLLLPFPNLPLVFFTTFVLFEYPSNAFSASSFSHWLKAAIPLLSICEFVFNSVMRLITLWKKSVFLIWVVHCGSLP